MNWPELFSVSLLHSAVFCGVFTVLIVGGCLISSDAMLHDYPQAIQDRHGPKSRRGRVVSTVMGAGMALAFVASPTVAMLDLAARTGSVGFFDGLIYGVVLFLALNVFDLLIIDWWLFCTVQPKFFVVPGTEDMPQYRDKMFHLKVLFPLPVLMIPGFGLIVGAVTAGIAAVV